MDYDKLINTHSYENHNPQNQRYKEIKDVEDISPAGKIEIEKAKSILSVVSTKSNLSLYDHLCSIIRRVLRFGIDDAVDKLEEISKSLKQEKGSLDVGIEGTQLPDETLENFITRKKLFYRLHSTDKTDMEIRTSMESYDDAEEDIGKSREVTFDLYGVLPDLHYKINRFRLGGIGLCDEEVCELNVGLRNLAQTHKLKMVHFWGKIFATKGIYYIAESPYQNDITRESFDWEKQKKEEKSIEDDGNLLAEKNSKDSKDNLKEMKYKRKLFSQETPISRETLGEEEGTGINGNLYFVTTDKMDEWRCLPSLQPYHIKTAKRIRRFFTGDLETEVEGGIPFPGKEAHFLRAQIARINAATRISLENCYLTSEGNKAETKSKDQEYVPKSVKEVFEGGLESWVHCERPISDQVRIMKVKTEQKETKNATSLKQDADSDEDQEEEHEASLFRSLSKDNDVDDFLPWTIKLSSRTVPETSVIIVRSNVWPGAYTYYDGKHLDNVYIGYGYKYSKNHYGPVFSIKMQKEYPTDGSDFVEEEDTIESEGEISEENNGILAENNKEESEGFKSVEKHSVDANSEKIEDVVP